MHKTFINLWSIFRLHRCCACPITWSIWCSDGSTRCVIPFNIERLICMQRSRVHVPSLMFHEFITVTAYRSVTTGTDAGSAASLYRSTYTIHYVTGPFVQNAELSTQLGFGHGLDLELELNAMSRQISRRLHVCVCYKLRIHDLCGKRAVSAFISNLHKILVTTSP